MKPTPAQLKYLRNAADVSAAGTGRLNWFSFAGPGGWHTARVCLRRGWIAVSLCSRYIYCITYLGRQVLAEGEAKHG